MTTGAIWLATLAAGLAAVSWFVQAPSPHPFGVRLARAVAIWAMVSALVLAFAALLPASRGWLVLLATALATVAAVAGAVRLVTSATRSRTALAGAVADAVLLAAGGVSVVWSWFAPTGEVAADRVVAVLLTTLALAVVALVLRLPVTVPQVDARLRGRLGVGALAVALVAVAAATVALGGSGGPLPALAVGAGFVAAAWLPWVGQSQRQPSPAVRSDGRLPYVVVALALLGMLVRSATGGAGLVSVLLVTLVVTDLIVVQRLALREKAVLVAQISAGQARLTALVENAGDVILALDGTGRVTNVNAAARALLAREPVNLVGTPVEDLALPEDRDRVRGRVQATAVHDSSRVELRLAPPASGVAEMRLRGVPDGAVAVLSDVTEAVDLRQRLEHLSRYDPVTDLANRRYLLDVVSGWLTRGATVSLLYADLNGFKGVNDRFGHLAGDVVLREIAGRLRAYAAGLDSRPVLVGRLGGDEFLVALRDTGTTGAIRAADQLVRAMRPSFTIAGRTVRLGVSVGVAGTEDDAATPPAADGAAELLHRADLAMFAAKRSPGRDVAQWTADVQERALRRVDIAIGLRQALDTGRLDLAYQPIVRLSDGVVVAVEALVRVPRDDRPGALAGLPRLVTPAELVEVAEDTGEITELGQWVLPRAAAQGERLRAHGHPVSVSVNMSVRQLSATGFADDVRKALLSSGLPAQRLTIEITEGQLLGETDPARAVLTELGAEGVEFVIDDFGTGYASLAYLRSVPVSGIKLDRTLLVDVGRDAGAATLVRAVIDVARSLNFRVVAEGLETLGDARAARDLGAWAGQGFALCQALDEKALLRLLDGPPIDLSGHP